MKERHLKILAVLVGRGGRGTTRQIAEELGLNVNGVSQSLGAMSSSVVPMNSLGADTLWEIKRS